MKRRWKTSRAAASAIAISSLLAAPFSAAADESDFKDFVIATYETAMTLRALTKTQGNPDYDRLISECRYHLYKSMSVGAETGRWSDAERLIPKAEICSYTGNLKPETIEEYQNHWRDAERLAQKSTRGAIRQSSSPSASPPGQASVEKHSAPPSDDLVVSQKQPCYIGMPCKVAIEKRRPQAQSVDDAATTSSRAEASRQIANLRSATIDDLNATKREIISRSPRATKPFEVCEKSMRYPMEVSLITERATLSPNDLAAYQAKMALQSLRSCVCTIKTLENAFDSREAEENYIFIFEHLHASEAEISMSVAVRGLDERKIVATGTSALGVVDQCAAQL
ncbi:hypothetical protein [Agrobacterium salinitolerans]|uniref:hypothetical protein n=1 Tax=Agrobacterium salinitolerans TaxID=1183413 RepID=UPI0022B8439E|nr:hypothetical protein [Agrobacterium salinitolerans]MCZ7888669.1 hypothetical protein [Agrobacterium salinitolerans]